MEQPASHFDSAAFAQRLQNKLQQQALSQNQLALAIGVSRSTVTGWLRHRKLPDAGSLSRICQELNCNADWLLGLSSPLEKSDQTGSIRWLEQIPPYINGFQREQIERGVWLFNLLVGDDPNGKQIINDYNLRYLQFSIQAAFRSGAIRLTHIARDDTREARIKARYPFLKDVVVAAIPEQYEGTIIRAEFVAFLAATEVLNTVVRESTVGLGTGYTLLRMCEHSIPSVDQFKGTQWLPLVTYTDDNRSGYTANQLTRFMQVRHPGSEAIILPHPALCETDSNLMAEFQHAQYQMQNLQAMFVTVNGVGRRDRTVHTHPLTDFRTADYAFDSAYLRDRYAELRDKEAFGGELLGILLDIHGQPITWDKERVWQINLDVLRYSSDLVGKVCIVAARHYKSLAVATCIQNGLANALVVDSEIASDLLQ